jgi:hypothetical protein
MKPVKAILLALTFPLLILSCEKDKHVPPNVSLKTGTGYISGDATVPKDTIITVGFIADKTEDELKTFNVSAAFDGGTSTADIQTFQLTAAEENHYEKDLQIHTRNQAGTEKWIFTITDRDGNIAQQQIVLTVQ